MLYRVMMATTLAFFSLSAFSQMKWSDIDKGSKLRFAQEIKLETTDVTKSFLIQKGSRVAVNDRIALSMINVEMFKMELVNCSDSSAKGEMQLFDIEQANGKIVTAGIELTGDCHLEVFIETKDIYSKSLFK